MNRSARALILLAGTALVAPFHARAADEGAAAPAAIEHDPAPGADIVVTATRKETRLQQTPVAVSVIGKEFRSLQNVITARDLAGQIPGLYTAPTGITPLTNTFFIRGIGNSDPIFDPTVGVYIDDVYLPRAINGMSDLTDVERVEVLRGPQGTLFGANSAGGAIRYVTKTPGDHLEARGDVGFGSYNTVNTHGYVSGALIPGLLAASLAVAHDQHDGYTWNPSLKTDVNNQNTTGGRIKLLFTPTSRLKITLTADGTVDHSQAAQYVATTYNASNPALSNLGAITGGTLYAPTQFSAYQPNVSYAGRYPVNYSHSGGITARVDYTLDSHLALHSITALRAFDQDPVNYNNDGQARLPYNSAQTRAVDISDNYIAYHEHEFTQELQVQGNWKVFDFTAGLYYLFENFSSNRIGYVTGLPQTDTALPAAPFDQIGDTRSFNYSAYAQGNVHLTDKLTLTAGGRYIIQHRAFTFSGVNDDLDGNPIDPALYPQVLTGGSIPALGVSVSGAQVNFTNAAVLNTKTWRSFTPKAGLSWQATPTAFFFVDYAKGFDAGGFNNRALSVATALPYNPETVNTFEGGIKTDWFNHRLRINATGFYNDYKNLQTSVSAYSPVSGTYVSTRGNAPSAHTDGFELETSGQPTRNLALVFNLTYLQTRFDDYAAPSYGTVPAYNYTGKQFSGQPQLQYFGSVTWTIPLHQQGTIKLGGSGNFETSYFSDTLNSEQYRIPAHGYANAFLNYETPDGHWNFTLTARNLTNSFYFSTLNPVGSAIKSGAYAGTLLLQGAQNAPRTIFVKAAYSY
ncbi:TonB-dependent receptor [Novosphingobium nitrogenifigens DSM 19370]|uniref:TonB-dependent receptor n=1 Tax=Novosphingobium nitrogenifigens DSM 19370 TaxID=983920 RepID=F1Z3Z2_9SPHN|nr:TonB-dependent receptor [Novosphingobium nitrogenifigens]EGD60684.1 TonB-dependent receptor [Novosphingobium nitrogenifigens DSM 19370]